MRIVTSELLFLVIDIQERLFNVMKNKTELEHNIRKLDAGLKLFGIQKIITQQYTKGLGETLEGLKEEGHFEKSSFSCIREDGFLHKLQESDKSQIIIAGIEAHICVMQSVLDLKDNGYKPIVVVDCIDSRKELDKEIALRRFQSEGILLTTTEALLFEICKSAQNDKFRELSKIIK